MVSKQWLRAAGFAALSAAADPEQRHENVVLLDDYRTVRDTEQPWASIITALLSKVEPL